jgi:hypothetical protein
MKSKKTKNAKRAADGGAARTPDNPRPIGHARTSRVPESVLPGIVERIRNGGTVGAEAAALGMAYRTTLISALTSYLGVEEYKALVAGNRRTKGVRVGAAATHSKDDKARIITTTQGWPYRREFEHEPRIVTIKLADGNLTMQDCGDMRYVVISPDGDEYTVAEPTEPADLLVPFPSLPGRMIRLVAWKHSAFHKRQLHALAKADRAETVAEKRAREKKEAKAAKKETIAKHS